MVNEFAKPDDASSSSYRHNSFHLQPLFRKSVRTIAILHDPIPPLSSIMLSKLRPDMFLLFRYRHVRYSSHPFSIRLQVYKRLLLVGKWHWIFILDCGIHTTETWIWHIISCDQVFGTIWRRGGGRKGEKGDQVSESCNYLLISLFDERSIAQIE